MTAAGKRNISIDSKPKAAHSHVPRALKYNIVFVIPLTNHFTID